MWLGGCNLEVAATKFCSVFEWHFESVHLNCKAVSIVIIISFP